MYFFVFILLFLILLPNPLEKKYISIIYSKIFIVSIIYFYYLNIIDNSLLTLILTLISFFIIIQLIYRLLNIDNNVINEDKTIFNLAHEVKNPIAVCKGYLDMLDINDKEKIEKYIPIIKKEMNRSLTIMNEFLDLKRITVNKDLMDFSLLIDDIKETTLYVLKEKKVNLKITKIDSEIIIDGDYDKLKQVLMNLIKNSYEAECKNIKIDIKTNDEYLKIKIIDDGKGINKEDLKRIGEVFYTTKVDGTGIGVSMSREIIKLHNGKLYYDSVINKKTTATIILPIKYIF